MNDTARIRLILQNEDFPEHVPDKKQFIDWLELIADNESISGVVTLRLVSEKEMQQLNNDFRQQNKPTNVLSFPYEPFPGEAASHQIGDLVICVPVLITEASAQNKNLLAHWAHLTIHGFLHLLGYDHETNQEAHIMETKEIAFLQQLGYANPYA